MSYVIVIINNLSPVFYLKNINTRVNITPANVKYSPFLKIVVFGKNIQKADITKNNSDTPKKTFRKNNGCPLLALCNSVSFYRKYHVQNK
jgi:hypothetical protein